VDDTVTEDSRPVSPTDVTPIPISPRTRTLLLLVAVATVVFLFYRSPSLLPVLLGGGTLALVMSFPARFLARVVPRGAAIALVVVSLVLAVFLGLVILVPPLVRQLTDLISASPQLVSDTERLLRQLLVPLAERGLLTTEPEAVVANMKQGLVTRAQTLAGAVLGGVFDLLTGAVGTFLQLFGVLFIAIYLLADIRRFEAAYLRAVPARYRRDGQALWDELGQSLSRYLGGLLLSLAIQGVLAFVFVSLLGLPYALLLGLWTAATGVLPYVGAWLGAIPAVLIALTISPLTALLTAGAYLLINQLEGNVLTPRIQGEAVKVHPLLVFVAVFAGGEIAGLLGAALAVPILAVVRVLVGFFLVRLRVQPPRPAAAIAPAAAAPPAETRGSAGSGSGPVGGSAVTPPSPPG
jgi:predicted PurR-regulated permease PerM